MAAEEKAVQVMPVSFLNTADKIMENYENSSYNKMVKSPFEIMVAAVLAGMFIAFGASSSNVAAFGIEDVGMARTLTGCVFPVGLMLIVLVGGELFTGDCLMFGQKVQSKTDGTGADLCLSWKSARFGGAGMADRLFGAVELRIGGACGLYDKDRVWEGASFFRERIDLRYFM